MENDHILQVMFKILHKIYWSFNQIVSIISSNNNEGFSFFHVDFTELCSCFENDNDKLICLFAWVVKTDTSNARFINAKI